MRIEVTPEAKQYLTKKKNTNAVTLKMVMCGG